MPARYSFLTVSGLRSADNHMSHLEAAVARHRPDAVALVGDFLRPGPVYRGQLSNSQLALRLSKLPCKELILIRGPQEIDDWFSFQAELERAGRLPNALCRSSGNLGHITPVGFPYFGGKEQGDEPYQHQHAQVVFTRHPEWEGWLSACLRRYWETSRTLWFMSEPPAGTNLARLRAPFYEGDNTRAAIGEFSPLLVVCGCDHLCPILEGVWHDTIGSTIIVNTGQMSSVELHYALIEAEYASDTPGFPDSLQVTCYPKEEVLKVR